jgi:nicotinate-nucleotide adenylyltransferase
VHNAHLAIAECARFSLTLDEVLFVPAGEPWRKSDRAITDATHRLAMLRLAIAGNDAFGISDIELRTPGPSYTADTLTALAGERLDDEFWFIMGADALADLPSWRDPQRIVQHARLAVTGRGAEALAGSEGEFGSRIDRFDCPPMDISSTGIRERVRLGAGIGDLVPAEVAKYIASQGLYRA